MHLQETSGYSTREGGKRALWRWDRFADAPTQCPACRGPMSGGLTRGQLDPKGTTWSPVRGALHHENHKAENDTPTVEWPLTKTGGSKKP